MVVKVAVRETHAQEDRVNYIPWELATGKIICTGKKKDSMNLFFLKTCNYRDGLP